METKTTEKPRQSRIRPGLFDLFLVAALMIAVALYVYHRTVVQPLRRELAISRIYVVDLDSLVNRFRTEAVERTIAGEKVSPDEVAARARKALDDMLASVPPGAVVLDARCVVRGGTPLTLTEGIREEK